MKIFKDDLDYMFHLYHLCWAVGIVSLFYFFDLYIAIIILIMIGAIFVIKS
jgi:hypothetical protein